MPREPSESAHRKTQAQLFKQLRAAKPVEIVGLLHPSGIGGGWTRGDNRWTLNIHLIAWRVRGEPLRNTPLNILKRVDQRAIRPLMDRFGEYEILRVRARLAESNILGSPRALLLSPISRDTDPDLAAIARELRKPVRVEDPKLGSFTLDRRIDIFSAQTKWGRMPVHLHLDAATPRAAASTLPHARALFRSHASWDRRARARAVADLLKLKNEGWLNEGDPPVTARQFASLMKIDSISIHPSGRVELWYDDGDLFFGHSIVVRGTIRRGPTTADIEG